MSRGGVSFSVGRDHRDRDRCDQPPCSMQRPTPLHRRPSLPPSLSLSLPRPPFYSPPLPPLPAREGPRTCTTPTTTPSPSFTGHVIAKSIPNANRAFPRGSNSSLVPFFREILVFRGDWRRTARISKRYPRARRRKVDKEEAREGKGNETKEAGFGARCPRG